MQVNRTLVRLDMGCNVVGPDGAVLIAEALKVLSMQFEAPAQSLNAGESHSHQPRPGIQ